ncbi:MAG TPA: HD domain-containing protein, partial [Thermomicrobiaceae bacterium]|nr:HD domain-containing protein [Thermomicrobiaceae bacterium]
KTLLTKASQLRRTPARADGDGAEAAAKPDFAGAKRHALERLERELAPEYHYHSVKHTRDEVLPAVERIAEQEGVSGDDLLLLRTAALYHDIGFIEQASDNEAIGVRIAAEALPRFGYSRDQIDTISGIIMATKLPQTPHNRLEEIMADADLDIFGSDDFVTRNEQLRAELAGLGSPSSDDEWYRNQLAFMRSHEYFTASARALLGSKKQANIRMMEERLQQIGTHSSG